ncbi:MAG: iron hydrogenase small subunit, partial [Spirochaetales bacterium]|nr:iron hydrogenase small subunit [Spirochaetales bacterium]
GERQYDFVEIMACPGGCVAGAGQPVVSWGEKEERGKGLYSTDKMCSIKRSEENPVVLDLYAGLLKGRVHELLHASYDPAKKEARHA